MTSKPVSDPTPGDAAPLQTAAVAGAYEVIARRYRPRTFREVVGQEAIAETLLQAIRQDRLGHAYLFCGPRGVGKTSMARIFARALQCPNAEDGVPCDRCGTCDRIFRGEDVDVVEMDGASHRGIDDVRELIQHVRYAPTEGPYRLFIIDEVHMLTREAFNSLLKTLEEPPPHVKFIFATTEPEKVLPTVLSRCQRFDFSPISPADIVTRLAQICEAEGATPEDGLLERIASLARGGMRDSQSFLDQLLSFAGTSPANADLDKITGRLAPEAVDDLLGLIERGERAAVVMRLEEVGRGGTDPAVLLEQVIEALRGRLHAGVAEGWGETEIDRNLLAQEILQEARTRVRRLGRADIILELALLRLSTLADLVPLSRWQEALGRTDAPRAMGARDAGTGTGAGTGAAPGAGAAPGTGAENRSRKPEPEPEPEPETGAGSDDDDAAAESPSAARGVDALREAVDRPARRAPAPAVRKVAAETVGPPSDGPPKDPREAALAALRSVSGSAARAAGGALRIAESKKGCTVELPEVALGILGEKRDVLRRELAARLGTPVRIELGEFEPSESQTDTPVAETDAEAEVPDIVEKAVEIYRGELFRGGPRPRRQ